MAENKYQAGGKPMPRTVQDFLDEIQNRGFDVKLSRRGEDKGTPKTWLIRWRGIAVG